MRTELYLHISSIYPTNFILLTPNEQLKVLKSEEFIHLTMDFVEQAWRKRQSVMFNYPSYIYSNVFYFYYHYYYYFLIIIMLLLFMLCSTIQSD